MDPKRKVHVTAKQMRQMVAKIEAGLRRTGRRLKGKGAVDYSSPTVLQAYMRKHPMSKLQFYVDKGGVTGSGKKKGRMRIAFQALVRKVANVMKRKALSAASAVEAEAKKAGKKLLRKGADAAVAGIENMADAALAGASAAVDRVTQNAVSALKGKGHKVHGGHYYNKKGEANSKVDENAKHSHRPEAGEAVQTRVRKKRKDAGKKRGKKGKKRKAPTGAVAKRVDPGNIIEGKRRRVGGSGMGMYGAGHMDGSGMGMYGAGHMDGCGMPMHGGRMTRGDSMAGVVAPQQRDDGGAAADSLGGLNYVGGAFVAAPVMQAAPGAVTVPYNNHLRNMQFAPAGGYGGMGFIM